jgi:CRP-like cAMP-binding protein
LLIMVSPSEEQALNYHFQVSSLPPPTAERTMEIVSASNYIKQKNLTQNWIKKRLKCWESFFSKTLGSPNFAYRFISGYPKNFLLSVNKSAAKLVGLSAFFDISVQSIFRLTDQRKDLFFLLDGLVKVLALHSISSSTAASDKRPRISTNDLTLIARRVRSEKFEYKYRIMNECFGFTSQDYLTCVLKDNTFIAFYNSLSKEEKSSGFRKLAELVANEHNRAYV